MNLLYLTWDVDPRVISDWNTPRWYGIMWVLGLYLGFLVIKKMFKAEKVPDTWLDKIFIYTILGAIIGARLGHCLFYQPDYYLSNPIEILKIWEGGLASHGGVAGIIISSIIYSRRVSKRSLFWILDRLAVPTALAGCFIRLGNLFNHEIVGIPTDLPWGVHFTLNDAEIIPRHPAQVYEALAYLLIFGVMMYLFWKTNAARLKGFLIGAFFVMVFTGRFLIEFVKEHQEGIDQKLDVINMGQILSIPLILLGLFLVLRMIKELKKGRDFEEIVSEEKADSES